MIQTYAPASQSGYKSDLVVIRRWMGNREIDEVSLGDYLTAMKSKRTPNTLLRHLSAIKHDFHSRDEISPSDHPLVIRLMREIRSGSYYQIRRAEPLTPDQIRHCIDALPDRPRGVRDCALLTVGWRAAPIERAALVSLEVRDIRLLTNGNWQLKTTQRNGSLRVEREQRREYDLWDAVASWRELGDISTGPLWRSIDRHGNVHPSKALGGQTVSLIVKEAVERIGIDPLLYSSNSLKALAE